VPLTPQPGISTITYHTDGNGAVTETAVTTALPPLVPFVFIAEVINTMDRDCIAVFAVPVHQQPSNMEAHCQPRHWHRLMNTQTTPSKMRLTDINIPDSDEPVSGRRSFAELHDPRAATAVRMTELQLWAYMERAADPSVPPVWSWYLRDLELPTMDVWGTSPGVAGSRAYKADKGAVRHYLNTNLFTPHAKSLFSILPADWVWRGVTSASCYLKMVLSIFRMHFEQAFFPAYNACTSGASHWYFVRDEHLPRLNALLVELLKKRYRLERQQPMTDEELAVLPFALYSRSLWLSPRLLLENGIPVERVVQTAGQVVVVDGCILHWGMVGDADDPHCVQEAINFCPQSWLTRGLKRLVAWMADLHRYLDVVDATTNGEFASLMCTDAVQLLLAHHAPANMVKPLLEKLKKELKSQTPSFAGFNSISSSMKEAILADVERVMEVYKEPRVQQLFRKYEKAF
jgi:hypothetical protein